jgi:Tol biopolymer transport system component/predicted Ser/Thr protein kinase
MSLAAGASLGPYQVIAPLGAGGMGEVYKARDTRLGRDVALKILPEAFASNAEYRERFEREARTVSSLNHAHICALYDIGSQDGVDFLVMEYLEGEALADRLKRGALPLDEALRLGIEIADALEAAHRKGVIHRDLKPANVMLTGPKGEPSAKLLDFGLAKMSAGRAGDKTVTHALTTQGAIVGTLAYMAPELFDGQEADIRSDIFAFGAALHEMLTGQRAFDARGQASLIAAIVEHDPPPVSSIRPRTPPDLDHLVRRCLAKDPDRRWQTATDIKEELRWIRERGASATAPAPRRTRSIAWAWAAALLALAAVAAVGWLRPAPLEDRSLFFSILPPAKTRFVPMGPAGGSAISPDGTQLAFVATGSRASLLYIHDLQAGVVRALTGTDGASHPFWSPDGRFVGFSTGSRLRKVELSSGSPQTITELSGQRGATWNREGIIVFSDPSTRRLNRVAAAGGKPEPLTELDRARGENAHYWPEFLPDGRHVVFLVRLNRREESALAIISLDDKPARAVAIAPGVNSNVRYAPGPSGKDGYLIYARERTLVAQPFDPRSRRFTGDAKPLVSDIRYHSGVAVADFSISQTATLVFGAGGGEVRTATWMTREGKIEGRIDTPGTVVNLSLARDGKRAALTVSDERSGNADIWVHDVARGALSRLTFDPAYDGNPAWSRDGKTIVYTALRGGALNLFRRDASGAGEPVRLTDQPSSTYAADVSPDGRFALYTELREGWDVRAVPLDGGGKPFDVVATASSEYHAQFSPDGRWVAYASDEGNIPQIYVRAFSGGAPASGGARWQVSNQGGTRPRWRADGRELFYVAGDGHIMAAGVLTKGDAFEAATPAALFDARLSYFVGNTVDYDVTPDGRRFLVALQEDDAVQPMTILTNLYSRLHGRD